MVVGWLTTHIVSIYNKHVSFAHCNVLALSHFVKCNVQHKNVQTEMQLPCTMRHGCM